MQLNNENNKVEEIKEDGSLFENNFENLARETQIYSNINSSDTEID